MFFERIERELTDGEPWSAFPVNRMEWSNQHRDYWEMEKTQKPTSTHKPLRTNLRFWRNWGFWKWLFSGKQVQYVTLNSSENKAGETLNASRLRRETLIQRSLPHKKSN